MKLGITMRGNDVVVAIEKADGTKDEYVRRRRDGEPVGGWVTEMVIRLNKINAIVIPEGQTVSDILEKLKMSFEKRGISWMAS